MLGFIQLDFVALSLYHMFLCAAAVSSAIVIKRQIRFLSSTCEILCIYMQVYSKDKTCI